MHFKYGETASWCLPGVNHTPRSAQGLLTDDIEAVTCDRCLEAAADFVKQQIGGPLPCSPPAIVVNWAQDPNVIEIAPSGLVTRARR